MFGAPELKGLDGENLGEITIEATQTGGLSNKIKLLDLMVFIADSALFGFMIDCLGMSCTFFAWNQFWEFLMKDCGDMGI